MNRCLSLRVLSLFVLILASAGVLSAQPSPVVHFVCLNVEGEGYKLTISRSLPTKPEIANVAPGVQVPVRALVLIEGAFDKKPYGAGYSSVSLTDFLDGKADLFPITLTQLPQGEDPSVTFRLSRSSARKIVVLEWRLGKGPAVVYSAMRAD
jgi:hypothetical protein